jgi:hypothetical protein
LLDFRSKNTFFDAFGRKRYGWCPTVRMFFFLLRSVEKEQSRIKKLKKKKEKRKNEITAKDLIHVKANKGKTVNSLGTQKR